MKKNKFYYIFILTISLFIISSPTSLASEDTLVSTASKAEEDFGSGDRNFFNEIIQAVDEKIISPVKQKINSMKNKGIEKTSNEIIDEVQDQVKEKQEELMDKAQTKAKETIKEKSRNFVRNKIEWIKDTLNPLKIKIQQGSNIIRREVNKVKNYLKDLF